MDYGAFILWALDALGIVIIAPYVIFFFVKRKPIRFRALWIWCGMGGFLIIASVGIYKTYFLNEGLVCAAMSGDTAEAIRLLAHGANPNSKWEDGTTALQYAKRNGNTTLAAALKAAGAVD